MMNDEGFSAISRHMFLADGLGERVLHPATEYEA